MTQSLLSARPAYWTVTTGKLARRLILARRGREILRRPHIAPRKPGEQTGGDREQRRAERRAEHTGQLPVEVLLGTDVPDRAQTHDDRQGDAAEDQNLAAAPDDPISVVALS